MSLPFILLLITSITCVVCFALTVVVIFKRHDPVDPKRYLIIKYLNPVAWALYFYQLHQIPEFGGWEAGTLACHALALCIFVWAYLSMRKKRFTLIFSSDVPEEIVQSGIYRFVRHPYYTSYIIFYLGCILLARTWYVALPQVLLILTYVYAALGEESKITRSVRADLYRQYMARTGRFFPRLF